MKKYLSIWLLASLMTVAYGHPSAHTLVAECPYHATQSVEAADDEMGYVDLGLPSGTLWADRNVGASSVSEVGERFAWGETSSKKYYDWGTYFDTDDEGATFSRYFNEGGLTELAVGNDAATAYCGTDWRMPTFEQFQELVEKCSWSYTAMNGQSGFEIVGPNGNTLFLPEPGAYTDDRYPMVAGSFAYYWTRSLSATDSKEACSFYFTISSWGDREGNTGTTVHPSMRTSERSWGQAVRAVYLDSSPGDDPDGGICVTPTTLDFGSVKVGESKTLSFTIENNCDSPIFVQMVAESFGNFSFSWNGDSIPQEAEQTVDVIYTPNPEIDGDSLQLLVKWNDMNGDETIVVELYGQCADTVQQRIPFSVEPSLLDFSQMIIGGTRTLTLYVTNQSYETQQVLDFSQNLPDNLMIDWTGGGIGPGSTQEVKATYTAVQELPMTSYDLTISNENMFQEGTSLIVPVWMSAEEAPEPVYAISASPEEMVFEKVTEGKTQTKVLTISNNTDEEVAVRDFSINSEQFTTDWNGGTLQAGEIRAVHVTYAPKETGSNASANISLATTEMAANGESITIPVKGTASDMPAFETAKTHLVLRNKDGSRIAFILAEYPKVSFAEDKILIETAQMAAHYDLDSFQRFTYETEEDVLTEITQLDADGLPFSQEREHLNFISGTKNLNVRVITADGTVIQQIMVHKGETLSLPLDLFETGVYLIEVNGETFKLFLR